MFMAKNTKRLCDGAVNTAAEPEIVKKRRKSPTNGHFLDKQMNTHAKRLDESPLSAVLDIVRQEVKERMVIRR